MFQNQHETTASRHSGLALLEDRHTSTIDLTSEQTMPETEKTALSTSMLSTTALEAHPAPEAQVHPSLAIARPAVSWLKRTFDIVGAATLLLILSPVFLVTALAVKMDSAGPVFYRQQRVGLGAEHFDMFKFRSMRQGADAQLQKLLAESGTAHTPLHKITNDPRITRTGQFLRKHSIDELPQLINVLQGSMSLVGPRPQRDAEVELYKGEDWRRLTVRPGMSGLWQVSGRSSLSWEQAIELDLQYVDNWSLGLDISILRRTAGAVTSPGESAH